MTAMCHSYVSKSGWRDGDTIAVCEPHGHLFVEGAAYGITPPTIYPTELTMSNDAPPWEKVDSLDRDTLPRKRRIGNERFQLQKTPESTSNADLPVDSPEKAPKRPVS